VFRDDVGDLADRIEDAAGGLAMNGGDVGNGRVLGQQGFQRGEVRRAVLGATQRNRRTAHIFGDLHHALAIGAVDQHQQPPVARQQRAQRRLHRKSAGALDRHADIIALAAGDQHQLFPDAGVQRDELLVAAAPIAKHRLLDGQRGGQRPGREKEFVITGAGGAQACMGCRAHDLCSPKEIDLNSGGILHFCALFEKFIRLI
jgi:hypothetical protein